MLRFAVYGRVSTGEQTSIPTQLETLPALAASLGGSVTMTESDVLTGFNDNRPGYQRILEAARRHEIDGVLVWKVDRLGRNHVEGIRAVSEFDRLGIIVRSATENLEDPFVRDLLLLLANREARVLAERIKLMHQANVRSGQWQSRPPMGYVLGRTGEPPHVVHKLEIDPLKAPLVRQVFEAAAEGKHSVRQLRDLSHAIGLTTSGSKPLSGPHMHKLLTNPVYQGDVVYGREANSKFEGRRRRAREDWIVVENAHPAIIDRETFALVQAAFAQHKRVPGDVRRTKWLLTSLIFCGHCGSRMYGASHGTKTKAGNENYGYSCQRNASYGSCIQKQAGGVSVDGFVKGQLSRFVVTDEVRRMAESMVRETEQAREQESAAQRRNLLRQRERLEKERRELAEGFMTRGKGVVPFDVYMQLESEKVQAMGIIDRTLMTIEEVRPLDITGELAALELVDWENADAEAWRAAVVLLIEKVVVRRGAQKGKPVVEIGWTPAASVIREAVASAV